MTIWHPTDDGHADLSSHDSFTAGAPHNTFARLRREDPMAWCDFPGAKGFWSVTRHADILALNREVTTLSSAHGIRMEDQTEEEVIARRTFQETDPPEHSRTRLLVAKAFSKPMVALFEEQIRDLCREILDSALAQPEFCAVKHIARQLPMRMLGRILGTPDEDLDWLVAKGDALIANTDAEFTTHVLDQADTEAYRLMPFRLACRRRAVRLRAAADGRQARARRHKRRAAPDHPAGHGRRCHQRHRVPQLLLPAGGRRQRHHALLDRRRAACLRAPGRAARAAARPAGKPRCGTPRPTSSSAGRRPRCTSAAPRLRDFEFHGKPVRQGDKVVFWFVSGNRDETAVRPADARQPAAQPNRHLAFGQGGPHVCLGMWLARLEVRVLLQEFAARVRRVEPAGEHQFLRSNFVGGLKRLPLRFTLQ